MGTFGYSEIGGLYSNINPDYKSASRFQCLEYGQAISLTWYGRKFASGTSQIRLGIYSDNNGEPDVLLGYTHEITINDVEQWWTENLVSPVSLTAGAWYWLAVICNNYTRYYYALGEGCRNADAYSDGFSDPFGFAITNSVKMSIYCTYTTVPTTVLKIESEPINVLVTINGQVIGISPQTVLIEKGEHEVSVPSEAEV